MFNLRMFGQKPPIYLLATAEAAQISSVEPVLAGAGASITVAASADAVLPSLRRSPAISLLLLDAALPGGEIEQLLATVRADFRTLPIVLIADTVTEEWCDRLGAGVIDDIVLRSCAPDYWEIRAEQTMRVRRMEDELEHLRESAAREAQHDRLTGVLNREGVMSVLFRETDRVQRSSGSLSVILFDIDDFGHWNSRLGVNICDELLCQVTTRTAHLLRSYDLLGRTGKDEFMIALPGCSPANAVTFAERLRTAVFAEPYHIFGESVRLSACFGIAQSLGRSPVVVLREAEQALANARNAGPETIEFGRSIDPPPPPVTFLSATSGEELLAW